MKAEQYARVKSIFESVCDLNEEAREKSLAALEKEAPELIREVRRLLKFHEPNQAKAESEDWNKRPDSLYPDSETGYLTGLASATCSTATKVLPSHLREPETKAIWPCLCRFFRIGGVPLFVATTLAIGGVFLLASFEMRRQLIAMRFAEMNRIANTFEQSVKREIAEKIQHFEFLSRSPRVAESITYLLERKSASEQLPSDAEPRQGWIARQTILARQLTLKNYGPIQFILRDSEGLVVTYSLDEDSEKQLRSSMLEAESHDFEHVKNGQSILHLPHKQWTRTKEAYVRAKQDSDAEQTPGFDELWFLIPIFNQNHNVVAVLSVKDVTAQDDFETVCSHVRFGGSGEVLPFDDSGVVLAPTRFDSELLEKDLLLDGFTSAAMNFRLAEPGLNLHQHTGKLGPNPNRPLIRPVAKAIEQQQHRELSNANAPAQPQPSVYSSASSDLRTQILRDRTAFLDYRGVKCLAVTRWLDDFGFGFVVKLDAAEAIVMQPNVGMWLIPGLMGLFGLLAVVQGIAVFRCKKRGELSGQVVGPYRIIEKIAEGGMGVVYKAQHEMLGRLAAVKVLRKDMLNRDSRARFDREVRLVARLKCEHTISVYDYGTSARGEPYFAMELLRGVRLDKMIAEGGPFNAMKTLECMVQIAFALKEAHHIGVVHRDLTPQNLIMTKNIDGHDSLVLIDFGLAKPVTAVRRFSEAGFHWSGTPAFMSPERIRDPLGVDPRSDLFSLGAIGYFMLTGLLPFEGETPEEIFRNILDNRRRVNPTAINRAPGATNKALCNEALIPDDQLYLTNKSAFRETTSSRFQAHLYLLVENCLAADPADRPQSMSEFLNLAHILLASPSV